MGFQALRISSAEAGLTFSSSERARSSDTS
jgi:hypothetical protein